MSAVKQRHIDFARAVVKLAREHKMDGLIVQFRDSFSVRAADRFESEQMHMTWAEGRHGDTSRISLKCDAHTSFDEREPDGVAEASHQVRDKASPYGGERGRT